MIDVGNGRTARRQVLAGAGSGWPHTHARWGIRGRQLAATSRGG